MFAQNSIQIAVVGLGYVGLPVATEFGKQLPTIGFDIDAVRIKELRQGHDRTNEVSKAELEAAQYLTFANDPEEIRACNVYIVAVPTPIDLHKQPDLGPLEKSSNAVGKLLSKGDIVIYESTVFPGATEDFCVPILADTSGLTFNKDFFVGYSPERINPGDEEHRLSTIVKVTSGSNPEVAKFVDDLYGRIVTVGTHLAPSIRVAEAAKVIENTQRDVNIALINELSLIFDRLGIDTVEVLEAAGTKWNFLQFRPGLVGGHCIGVDPYYLTHKAQAVGHHPEVVLAGRRINDGMGAVVVNRLIRKMIDQGIAIKGANVLIMGLTFKENCPDLRNTGVIEIVKELRILDINVTVHDPWADKGDAQEEFGIELIDEPEKNKFDAIICAVGHREYVSAGAAELRKFGRESCVLFDLKSIFLKDESDCRL